MRTFYLLSAFDPETEHFVFSVELNESAVEALRSHGSARPPFKIDGDLGCVPLDFEKTKACLTFLEFGKNYDLYIELVAEYLDDQGSYKEQWERLSRSRSARP